MSEPTLASVLAGADASPQAAAPVAGRTRTAVASGGNSITLSVGDSFEALYRGSSKVAGKFGESDLYKFELIAPAELTVVSKDKDTGVKSEERKTLEAGTVVSTFLKGNGPYMMASIVEGMDIEVRRVEDGVLPKGHKFAGTSVATFEILA